MIKYIQFDNKTLPAETLNALTENELMRYNSFLSVKRKAEFLYTRVLWHSFNSGRIISYDTKGRPYLENGGFISISHSRNIVAIAYHPTHEVGIDAEFKSDKLIRISKKFLSNSELQELNILDLTQITLAWSIKEAIYKMENTEGLSLKDNIRLKIRNQEVYADVIKDKELHHYIFRYHDLGEFVICWCSHEDMNGKSVF
ncbi:MAG: 4'-phosphopantetheinyl transferase superfamily protein [Crocinitomicaceae bacterium]|nr:4'-phosphopantetheinyl transferase superfamily protein [Crocinitomicaceae bacterium]MBK8926824.1 4'-phosphopantetheinyl transferase superfamily protein [Crocinitomicaceae bacterium]